MDNHHSMKTLYISTVSPAAEANGQLMVAPVWILLTLNSVLS